MALAKSDSETEIGKLVAAADYKGKKAAAARATMPGVQSQLAAARAEVMRLDHEREKAVLEYLTMRANEAAAKIFAALCRQHDSLVGISAALSSGDFGGEIAMVTTPLVVPNFNLPALSNGAEYFATLTHLATERTVQDASSAWFAARNRLNANPEAEIDDLIGPAVNENAK
jgi:hypothetical protein